MNGDYMRNNIKRLVAAVGLCLAMAGVVVAGTTVSNTPTASASTQTVGAQGKAVPDGSGMGFTCSLGQLCLHLKNVYTGKYRWTRWTACTRHDVRSTEVITWYMNNQTGGARGEFVFRNGSAWYTPKRYSSGRPPYYTGGLPSDGGHRIISWKTC